MIIKKKNIEINDDEVYKLSQEIGHSFVVTKILASRGYDTIEKIKKFLSPSLTDLHDPFLLKNMDVVTNKIKKALATKKRVLIFGDYDVDGISATAILYKYFAGHGLVPQYFLPNRYEDGYGLTIETAQKVIDLYSPELIITVDCGISCYKEVDYLMSKGVDVVVTDHHEIPEILPSCPIVNAKMLGQEYPFRELCGAGVALKIVQALGENLEEYLPICAIATIADIVSLTDENRAIVTCGLKLYDKLPKGVKMLIKEQKLKSISSSEIAFRVAPKINAPGRMGDATVSLKLYISDNQQILNENLEKLNEMNAKRQELCSTIYDEAIKMLEKENQNDKRAIILYSDSWDSGLLGIVSARLTEEFNKPSFLFSEVDGLLKGSVRSIPNINIHEILSKTSTLLETFGGHSMAAGLTLKKENLAKFTYEIENYLLKDFDKKDFVAQKEYDIQLESEQINMNLVNELECLEPCGCGNPKPIFYTKYSNLVAERMKNFPQHLNITTPSNFSLLAFNQGDMKNLIENSYVVELMFELQLNEFKGNKFIKGLCKNIKCSGYKDGLKDYVQGNYLEQLKLNKSEYKNAFYSYDNLVYTLNKLTNKSNYGTLIVCNNLENAKKLSMYLYTHSFEFHLGKVRTHHSNNSIIVGLNSLENLSKYNNFVFTEPLLNMDYLNNFHGNLYLPKDHEIDIKNYGIDLSHDFFSIFYKKLYAIAGKMIASTKYDYFLLFKGLCPELQNLTYSQFNACLFTFEELDFLTCIDGESYRIEINKQAQKRELASAKFYQRLHSLLD